MPFEGHKRRPTSMPAAQEELEGPATPPKNELKTYRAADGQILQSSMVKIGSPSKRQSGSLSQVRFSLPALDSDSSFEDGNELDIIQGFDGDDGDNDGDHDDFDKRSIFNLGSRELEAPIRGRSNSRSSISVADSLRELVSKSPERSRLFIRGESELNSQQLPIPIGLQLPPVLSPNNKGKKRPTSLIFNGTQYEPFELEFTSLQPKVKHGRSKSQDFLKSLPTPTSSTYSQAQTKSFVPSPPQKLQKAPIIHGQQQPSIPEPNSKQIEIPDLNKPYVKSPVKPKKFELDNEKEIENPSQAAQHQNNQLNKKFLFPAIPQKLQKKTQHQKQMSSGRITYPETPKAKDLPGLPPSTKSVHNQPQKASPGKGLEIFEADGTLASPNHSESVQGRFAHIEQYQQQQLHQPQHQDEQIINYRDDYYQIPESASRTPRSNKGHRHRRTQSQIIDFPVDKLNDLPQTKEVNHERANSNEIQPEHEDIVEAQPQFVDEEEDNGSEVIKEPLQERVITPESEYSPYEDIQMQLPEPQAPFTAQEEDTSIQSSVDITQK